MTGDSLGWRGTANIGRLGGRIRLDSWEYSSGWVMAGPKT